MNFQLTQNDWAKRRADLQTYLGEVERFRDLCGKRTDAGATWARSQLEGEGQAVKRDLRRTDTAFAAIEKAHAAFEAAAAEAQRTAVALEAADELHLASIHARRAEHAASLQFHEAARGFALPSVAQYPLRRGYLAHLVASVGGGETAAIAAKAHEIAAYVPGDRNGKAAAAHDVAYQGGGTEPARMVFEVASESAYPDARLAFAVRWARFAHLNGLPAEAVVYPGLLSDEEQAYARRPRLDAAV